MVREITPLELYEQFVYTLEQCGTYLLEASDDEIGYRIFEEFQIGAISFLHDNSLQRLKAFDLISDEVMIKSRQLRKEVMQIMDGEIWNIASIRSSDVWKEILLLSDDILNTIRKEKSKQI